MYLSVLVQSDGRQSVSASQILWPSTPDKIVKRGINLDFFFWTVLLTPAPLAHHNKLFLQKSCAPIVRMYVEYVITCYVCNHNFKWKYFLYFSSIVWLRIEGPKNWMGLFHFFNLSYQVHMYLKNDNKMVSKIFWFFWCMLHMAGLTSYVPQYQT